jgi:hypothetical protein
MKRRAVDLSREARRPGSSLTHTCTLMDGNLFLMKSAYFAS